MDEYKSQAASIMAATGLSRCHVHDGAALEHYCQVGTRQLLRRLARQASFLECAGKALRTTSVSFSRLGGVVLACLE
jgi:hypothetical protein